MKFFSKPVRGFIMALSMFSIIPAPKVWDEDAQDIMLPLLPVIGAVIGALWYGFSCLLLWLSAPQMLFAALFLLFPLFMSGFLHMDGFMDTCDAIFSRAGLDKKRAILKDPHAGAFAVIALGVYLLMGFAAAFTALERNAGMAALFFAPVLPRCVAGVAALRIRPMWETGFVAQYRKNTKTAHTVFLAVLSALCACACGFFGGIGALIVICASACVSVLLCAYAVRQLDGISGDLCGFIIAGGELSALIALSLV